MRVLLLAILSMLFYAPASFADCTCSCVDGKVEAICTNMLDLKPICAPRICPFAPPSIKPMEPLTLAPLGMNDCEMKQVLNTDTNIYEWKRVCK